MSYAAKDRTSNVSTHLKDLLGISLKLKLVILLLTLQ